LKTQWIFGIFGYLISFITYFIASYTMATKRSRNAYQALDYVILKANFHVYFYLGNHWLLLITVSSFRCWKFKWLAVESDNLLMDFSCFTWGLKYSTLSMAGWRNICLEIIISNWLSVLVLAIVVHFTYFLKVSEWSRFCSARVVEDY
jgi:hypothetical protein